MTDADDRPDHGLLWTNLLGLTLAGGLLVAFFILYGSDFFRLLALLFGGEQAWQEG